MLLAAAVRWPRQGPSTRPIAQPLLHLGFELGEIVRDVGQIKRAEYCGVGFAL